MARREEGETSIRIAALKARLEKVREAKQNLMRQSRTPKIQKVIFLLREPVDDFRKYYEPKVVSLGPIHHGNPKYQLGENYKLLLTYEFIEGSGKNMEDVYNVIMENIDELRTCFEEVVTKEYDDEALTSILLVDGCAILQYIYCAANNKLRELNIKTDSLEFGQLDLFLLENQLPFRLLTWLMCTSVREEALRKSIEIYIDSHLRVPEDQRSNPLSWRLCGRSKPQEAQSVKEESHDVEEPQDRTRSIMPVHLLDHLRTRMLHGQQGYIHDRRAGKVNQNIQDVLEHWQSHRNVQELKTAGIYLKRGIDSYLRDISFTTQFLFRGQLHLPPIVVDDSTTPKFLNLIAYERCPDFENDFGITSYISFLNTLVRGANDVRELRKAGVLYNFLGSDERVAQLFDEMGKDLVPNFRIYEDVNSRIHKHYGTLMSRLFRFYNDHFAGTWSIAGFLGVVIGLILSAIQAWYTVKQQPNSHRSS